MKLQEVRALKEQIKSGSVAALNKYIEEELLLDSLRHLKESKDYRFYQARVTTLEEILKLLPKAQK